MIAAVTMLIDHVTVVFLQHSAAYTPLRAIGRLAFPIFAFLCSEGLAHTRRIWLYALRLLGFAFLSELPYDYCRYGRPFYNEGCNVFFTLFLAVAAELIVRCADRIPGRAAFLRWPIRVAAFAAAVGAALYMSPDYSWAGVVLVLLFFYLRDFRPFSVIAVGLFMALVWRENYLQMYALLSLPLFFFYNGRRGFINTWQLSMAFYIFYPAHLLLLFIISMIVL